MKNRVVFLLKFLTLFPFWSFSQNQLNYQNAVPSSPEVSSIAKNTDIPVNYTSGTPTINIPFYAAKSGDVEIPISLSYNASGIRVDESPTWVGLGWSLNTGPTLVRVVRGNPDDDSNWGYMNMYPNGTIKYLDNFLHDPSCLTPGSACDEWGLNVYPTGTVDLEPDIFSFSAFGYSGKFYWNQDSGKFILSPYQNIKIESPGSSIGWFKLTLPNGIQCLFGSETNAVETMDLITTISYVNGYEESPINGQSSGYITAWAIKQIRDPNSRIVEFSYDKDYGLDFGRGGETYTTYTDWMEPVGGRKAHFYKQHFSKPILTKITSENCDIYFKRNSSLREDVATAGKSLDTITIKNKKGLELKSYLFDYGYFISPSYTELWGIEQYAQIARKRLYLKAVQEKNITTQDSLPPYEFTYNSTELPDRLSASQDDWGYYNGKNNGNFLLSRIPKYAIPMPPYVIIDSLPDPADYAYSNGADRRIDTNNTQARILIKIKYPTGGITRYYYEQNRVAHWQFDYKGGMEHPDLVGRSHIMGVLLQADPPPPPYPSANFRDTFRIIMPYTSVKFTPYLPAPCNPTYNTNDCIYTVKICKGNALNEIYSFSQTHTFTLDLEPDKYWIQVYIEASNNQPNFSIIVDWAAAPDTNNFVVGGVRVKKIVSEDGFGNTISRSFNYNLEQSEISSGILAGYPVHRMEKNAFGTNDFMNDFYSTNSAIPLTTDGQTVRYEYVTEYYDSAFSSFKTEYRFYHDFLIMKFAPHNGAPPLTNEWQNNLLREKKMYEKVNNDYRIRSHEEYLLQPRNFEVFLAGIATKFLHSYNVATAWFLPFSQTTTQYSYPNNTETQISTTTTNFYNDNFLLSKSRTTNSKGQVVDNKNWYPTDYNNVNGYNISELLTRNILIPLKQEKSINGKIISGNIIKYFGTGLPNEVYKYENNNLVDTIAHDINTVLETNYSLKTKISYDADLNLKQLDNTNAYTTTYVWGYDIDGTYGNHKNELPIAIVQNADSNSVAYSSFENDSKGNWYYTSSSATDNTAPMGSTCFHLNSSHSIYKYNLNDKRTYMVSYWTKNTSPFTIAGTTKTLTGESANGLWIYFEHEVTGQSTITITGTGDIDEVRLYPKGAHMNTYAYKIGVGIIAECDANSKIIIYEYDGLCRLKLIRDQHQNILKKICYNYAGQPEECPLDNARPEWVATGNVRCQPCPDDNNYPSTIQEREEKDINSASNTHDQTRWIAEGPGTCISPADWHDIDVFCELDEYGKKTGFKITIQFDINRCSNSFSQTRSSKSYNPQSCPPDYSGIICSGPQYKMINSICTPGTWEIVSVVMIGSTGTQKIWQCNYAYCFPDGTASSYSVGVIAYGDTPPCSITCY